MSSSSSSVLPSIPNSQLLEEKKRKERQMENIEQIKKWETTMVEPQSPQFISAASPRYPWSPRKTQINDPIATSSFEFSCALALGTPSVTTADQIFRNWRKLHFNPVHAEMLKPVVGCESKVLFPMEVLREEEAKEEESYCVWKPRHVGGRNHGRGLEGLSRWLLMTNMVPGGGRKTKKKGPTIEVHPMCGGGGWGPKHCHGGRRKIDEWSYM